MQERALSSDGAVQCRCRRARMKGYAAMGTVYYITVYLPTVYRYRDGPSATSQCTYEALAVRYGAVRAARDRTMPRTAGLGSPY